MLKRMKNYGFWISIVSAILILLQAFGLKIDLPYINEIVSAVLGLLVILGIVNNPTDGGGYGDTVKPEDVAANNKLHTDLIHKADDLDGNK